MTEQKRLKTSLRNVVFFDEIGAEADLHVRVAHQ
jgi:hypothetical protein